MSTRSVIARPMGDGFNGRYHHWDGYPSGLGAELYWLAQPNDYRAMAGLPPTPWNGDIEAMLKVLLDDHPAGWSTLERKDFRFAPGYNERQMTGTCKCGKPEEQHFCQYVKPHEGPVPCGGGTYGLHLGHAYEPDEATITKAEMGELIPQCYCHGDRAEEAREVTDQNASGMGCEYAYVLTTNRKMTVLSSFAEFDGKTEKVIGYFGMGAEDEDWKPIGYVDLDGVEPNWKAIEEGQSALVDA